MGIIHNINIHVTIILLKVNHNHNTKLNKYIYVMLTILITKCLLASDREMLRVYGAGAPEK